MTEKTNYAIGHFAETLAIWYLRLKGYHLVARNFIVKRGTGAGEIDLIMTKGKTIIFFEVKKDEHTVQQQKLLPFVIKCVLLNPPPFFYKNILNMQNIKCVLMRFCLVNIIFYHVIFKMHGECYKC